MAMVQAPHGVSDNREVKLLELHERLERLVREKRVERLDREESFERLEVL